MFEQTGNRFDRHVAAVALPSFCLASIACQEVNKGVIETCFGFGEIGKRKRAVFVGIYSVFVVAPSM